jgi:hypothetical protein
LTAWSVAVPVLSSPYGISVRLYFYGLAVAGRRTAGAAGVEAFGVGGFVLVAAPPLAGTSHLHPVGRDAFRNLSDRGLIDSASVAVAHALEDALQAVIVGMRLDASHRVTVGP